MNAELLTYSRTKGVLAGIDLDGTSVSQNTEDTQTFYGPSSNFEQILKGNVATPAAAEPFVHTVAQYFRAATAA
jgi:SH3 domain-containing YSC84-like protein 1